MSRFAPYAVCGLPHEYCEFAGTYKRCMEALKAEDPALYHDLQERQAGVVPAGRSRVKKAAKVGAGGAPFGVSVVCLSPTKNCHVRGNLTVHCDRFPCCNGAKMSPLKAVYLLDDPGGFATVGVATLRTADGQLIRVTLCVCVCVCSCVFIYIYIQSQFPH